MPGHAIYKYSYSSACVLKRKNCDEHAICWRADEEKLRHYTQSTSTVFLIVGTLLLVAAYFKLDKTKFGKSEEENKAASGTLVRAMNDAAAAPASTA